MATLNAADQKTQHGFVYLLGSVRAADRRTYVGWCVDLDQRLFAHNAGRGARSTRGRFWVLLYAERYETRREAMSREVSLKRDRKFRATLALLLEAQTAPLG
ncbi:MAG: GIY-YIG nuclease family protein [Hyphomonadaceae bacterium JAD_PAG50586_4]|nr:MAG: GIY-YIG nuclease family protein [Hyphomonadaceae bacterium JAD_PAG50586_4]